MTDNAADDLALKGCTCFRLRRTARRATQIYDAHLAPAGLTLTQYSLLANLARRATPGIQELAEAMGMDRTTLTRNLKPLIERGLVRTGHGADRRSKRVEISETGLALWAEAKVRWRAAQEEVQARLGTTGLAALHRLLDESFARLG